MNKIKLFYNQNKRKIWKYVMILVLVIALVQILNFFSFLKEDNGENIKTNNINNSSLTNNTQSGIISNKSSITGEAKQEEVLTKAESIIKEFITYCNENNIQSAYNILSDDCKEELYQNSINNFKTSYYDEIFKNSTKLYTMQNWIGDTYVVSLTEDVLASGNLNSEKIEDYITIVNDNNGEYKVNINRYVGKRIINSSSENNNLIIKILSKQIYMDYEIYEFEIYNKTGFDICLDTKDSTTSTYLLGSNGTKYISYINEVPKENLIIKNNLKQKLKMKFNNSYTSNREIDSVCFSQVIFDYGNKNNQKEVIVAL